MITIQKKPFGIDFIENNPVFVLRRNSASTTRVKCRFRYSHTSSVLSGAKYTPYMYFDFNSDDLVTVGTNILKGYYDDMEVPRYHDGLIPVQIFNHEIFYKLDMYEIIGNTESSIYTSSSTLRLVNGFMDYQYRNDNITEWISNSNVKLESRTSGFDIFGQNDGDTVYAYRSSEQYIYLRNYGVSAITITPTLTLKKRDGTVLNITTSVQSRDFSNFNIPAIGVVMLRCDLNAFGSLNINISDVIEYTLTFDNSGTRISRRFFLLQDPYNIQNLMLKNSLNMYESFCIDNISKEIGSTGELVTVGSEEYYNITETSVIYTARTGLQSEERLRLLHSALQKNGNMLISGNWMRYISVIPSSWVVTDQREDLIEVEFQYKAGRKISRPYGSNESPSQGIGANVRISHYSVITSTGVLSRI